MARPQSRKRRRSGRSSRRGGRLVLESLEGRCVPSTVTNLNDAGDGSLRQAIIDTPAEGTVDFQAGLHGTITLITGELAISKDLIISGPGASVITVSGNHASRVFDITAPVTVAIAGLTITDGMTNDNGSGIFSSGALTVTDSTISGNYAPDSGGGIYNNSGVLTVTGSTISGNSASGPAGTEGGGGIYTFMGTVWVTDSTLSDNSASVGTGINNYQGMVTVTASTISGNSASYGGGGISNNGTLTVIDSTLSRNSSDYEGGAIFNSSGMLTISASTLSANSAPYGGAIYNDNYPGYTGTLTVAGSTLSSNSAQDGGGIDSTSAFGPTTVMVANSTLSDNTATGPGGGIYNTGALTASNSTFSGNSAQDGGGLLSAGTTTISSSTFSGNSSIGAVLGGGGAINNLLNGTMAIDYSTISGNTASGTFYTYAGGIFNGEGSTITVSNSTISGNSAAGYADNQGGGLFNFGTMTISDSTISGNKAGGSGTDYNGGGAIWNHFNSPLIISNSTISGNSAFGGSFNYAGGILDIWSSPGPITLHDTIVAGNTASSYPDLWLAAGSGLHSQGHNLIGDGTGGSGYDPTDLVGTSDNPIDPKLGPLQDNGGPTFTMAPLPSSPAIQAGDPTGVPPTDQRGLPRVLDGKIDIGAVELRVFHVTSTADIGPETLRQAILDANATPGTNGIAFALGAGGVQTIAPTSPLPAVTNPVEIDGTTQPRYAGTPLVELAGESAGVGADGLTLASPNSTITGLVVVGFGGAGVSISGNGNRVVGNFIGTDATGTMAHPNGTGVAVVYIGSNNTIGDTAPGAGNLISGNLQDGVGIYGGSGNTIQGNFIGADAAGLTALPNGYGVELYSGSNNSVGGGSAAGAGNLISGNLYDGIGIYSDGNTVQGNRIGTDATGTAPLGNGGDGVAIQAFLHGYDNAIGGTDPGAGNTIAYNGGYGVRITGGTGEAIHQNAIYANGAGGIVLLNSGNQDEPAPQLTSAVAGVGTVTVIGTVSGTPGAELVLEFFANTVCDPSGYGQGERFVGSTTVVVGPDGEASFTDILDGTVDVGQFITATATDPAGNTSPFSNCAEVTGMDIVGGGLKREAVLSGSVMPISSASNAPAATPAQALPGDIWANQAVPTGAAVPTEPMAMVSRAQDAEFEAWDTARDLLAGNWM
jgi:hypothetical protein